MDLHEDHLLCPQSLPIYHGQKQPGVRSEGIPESYEWWWNKGFWGSCWEQSPKSRSGILPGKGSRVLEAVLTKKACSWMSLIEEHSCCANQTAPARNGNFCPSLNALIAPHLVTYWSRTDNRDPKWSGRELQFRVNRCSTCEFNPLLKCLVPRYPTEPRESAGRVTCARDRAQWFGSRFPSGLLQNLHLSLRRRTQTDWLRAGCCFALTFLSHRTISHSQQLLWFIVTF